MFKAIDTLLILVIAVCTVVATGVTIHDANLNRQNPIAKDVRAAMQQAQSWFSAMTPQTKATANAGPQNSANRTSVQNLETGLFGQNVILPTLGSIFP